MSVQNNESLGLSWTGHPLYDYGLAALTAFNNRSRPEELTDADFQRFADFALRAYFSADMTSSITVLFTLNNFMNPSFSPETKQKKTAKVLNSFKEQLSEDLLCAYTNRPALDDVAARDLIPLLTGRDVVNFSPYGQTGLPVSGHTVVVLQALTVGALRAQGKAVVVAADDPELTLKIVERWLPEIRGRIQMSELKGEAIRSAKSRLIDVLLEIAPEASDSEDTNYETYSAITLYHLSNSGQGPYIVIYFLPAMVTGFIANAQSYRYKQAWNYISRQNWLRPKEKGGVPAATTEPNQEQRRSMQNFFYEDLFGLPSGAADFVRHYFKRTTQRIISDSDSKDTNNVTSQDQEDLHEEVDSLLGSIWNLTELFLEEVLNMERERIEAIRKLGEALAYEIAEEHDRRLFGKLTRQVRSYAELRNQLIQLKIRQLKSEREQVLDFAKFLLIFEEGEEVIRTDWKLAWDLTQIRMLDELHRLDWRDVSREGFNDPDMHELDKNDDGD